MSNIGIIAEYNPFHNGHKYLVKNAIKETGADGVIALMSGNFIQQGAPAMADKYTRAEAAVRGGVDIVFELPVIYATASARDFANGAVAMLSSMKNVVRNLPVRRFALSRQWATSSPQWIKCCK